MADAAASAGAATAAAASVESQQRVQIENLQLELSRVKSITERDVANQVLASYIELHRGIGTSKQYIAHLLNLTHNESEKDNKSTMDAVRASNLSQMQKLIILRIVSRNSAPLVDTEAAAGGAAPAGVPEV
jgi:hypothetical protein